MAVVVGTNSGFVATSPTDDPAGTGTVADAQALVTRDTSPATAVKVTEIGWWCDTASQAANFEIGIYAADGAVVPGEAGTLLQVARTNAKGTGAGWKKVAVDWSISPNTTYWIAVQLDDTATQTNTDLGASGAGTGWDNVAGATTLPDPLGGGALRAADRSLAIFALWEPAPAASAGNMLLLFP